MKYKIKPREDGLIIEVREAEGQQAELLKAFQACQAGRCTCPTQEYEKLADLEIEKQADAIQLQLTAKDGQTFNQAEIDKCLQHTAAQAKSTE